MVGAQALGCRNRIYFVAQIPTSFNCAIVCTEEKPVMVERHVLSQERSHFWLNTLHWSNWENSANLVSYRLNPTSVQMILRPNSHWVGFWQEEKKKKENLCNPMI